MRARSANPWIVCPRPNPKAALNLVCFPYAGGAASVFRTWPAFLPEQVELIAIELPGRGTRFGERPFDQIGPLVTAIADTLAHELNRPFAIFGHSMGAMLGFSFAHEWRRRMQQEPVHLFASARRAPQLPSTSPIHQLSNPQLLDRLFHLGGIPPAILNNAELMDVFLPILRADIAVSDADVAAPDRPLACPITALGGLADSRPNREQLEAWRDQTSATFECEMFPGDHFFIHGARAAVLATVSRRLANFGV